MEGVEPDLQQGQQQQQQNVGDAPSLSGRSYKRKMEITHIATLTNNNEDRPIEFYPGKAKKQANIAVIKQKASTAGVTDGIKAVIGQLSVKMETAAKQMIVSINLLNEKLSAAGIYVVAQGWTAPPPQFNQYPRDTFVGSIHVIDANRNQTYPLSAILKTKFWKKREGIEGTKAAPINDTLKSLRTLGIGPNSDLNGQQLWAGIQMVKKLAAFISSINSTIRRVSPDYKLDAIKAQRLKYKDQGKFKGKASKLMKWLNRQANRNIRTQLGIGTYSNLLDFMQGVEYATQMKAFDLMNKANAQIMTNITQEQIGKMNTSTANWQAVRKTIVHNAEGAPSKARKRNADGQSYTGSSSQQGDGNFQQQERPFQNQRAEYAGGVSSYNLINEYQKFGLDQFDVETLRSLITTGGQGILSAQDERKRGQLVSKITNSLNRLTLTWSQELQVVMRV